MVETQFGGVEHFWQKFLLPLKLAYETFSPETLSGVSGKLPNTIPGLLVKIFKKPNLPIFLIFKIS